MEKSEIKEYLTSLNEKELEELIRIHKTPNQHTCLYGVSDIQKIFGCNRNYAIAIMNSKTFPCFYINNKKLVEQGEFEKWLKKQIGRTILINT